jgi:uracil-DNA glycosylase family 4
MCWTLVISPPSIRAVEDFDTAVAAARRCSHCDGLPLGPKPIFQIGREARILIVGQAPGRLTHAKGLPFDDVSGGRLRQWMGISRETFYDDNLIACLPMGFCYPGKGRGGDLPPRPECAALWRPRLVPHMQKLQLTLVIGQYAHHHYFPDDSRNLTARVKAWDGGAIVPLPHPSPRNGVWLKANPWFETDILPKLREVVQHCLT